MDNLGQVTRSCNDGLSRYSTNIDRVHTQYVGDREGNNSIYGSPNSRRKLHNYYCYCSYVEDLRNSMVNAYFRTRTCLGDAANRQKMYYDRSTTPHHFKKRDLVIYWHKPTAMQTLSSGWTGPFVVTEKVSVVDYRIQLNPTGPSKVVHVEQLILDSYHQDRTNWVRNELLVKLTKGWLMWALILLYHNRRPWV